MSSYQVLVARVDCFSETPVSTYGKFLRQQVEGIMECFTSETVRKKNIDDMKEAEEAALEVKEKAIKKKKKASGTAKRLAEEIAAGQLKPSEKASADPIYDTNWCDMPDDIKLECIGKLKLSERLSLRCTAKAERSLVDSQKIEFTEGQGAKRQFVEELKQKAGEEFGHHIEKLKMIPFEAKAKSTAAAYKAENDKRNAWISEKKLPVDESSFLLYLLDRAKQIGSSALAKISAAYQTANEGISAIGASFVSDLIKSKRREESLLKKTVVEVTVEDVQKITMLAMKEDSPEKDRDALLAILSFNVMLRASEAAEIKWAGVKQKDGMIEVHVEKAKNDQLRLGRSSFFNYEPGSDADILMCRWRLRTKGKCPYVFSHLNSSKKLSKGAISTLSTKMLAAIGKPGATHHCFRRGGANHMRRIGHSMEEIQCRGRWRSAAGLKVYLTDVPTAQGCLQLKGAEFDDEDDDD
ncbi:hypothetical protein B9Z55_012762 [Caenorhabditis nigoni]|uniref:F-box domain-containing protein n=1 Tax=Caenorhabditis nigoni TaxID=1611254 RepID=A0A2G5TYW5_9PELO|nr:hypothetical protein B9Z55_012762 [Caenorhabditis nigoni]